MHGPWKITSNYIDGNKLYAVCRLIDADEVDHSGNRELATGYMADRAEAERIAAELNGKEQ